VTFLSLPQSNLLPAIRIPNQLKYKVVIKEKGCRKPKMTRHAKNTPCLDIIKDILKETSQEKSRK
jgi:hypothetical protein